MTVRRQIQLASVAVGVLLVMSLVHREWALMLSGLCALVIWGVLADLPRYAVKEHEAKLAAHRAMLARAEHQYNERSRRVEEIEEQAEEDTLRGVSPAIVDHKYIRALQQLDAARPS